MMNNLSEGFGIVVNETVFTRMRTSSAPDLMMNIFLVSQSGLVSFTASGNSQNFMI